MVSLYKSVWCIWVGKYLKMRVYLYVNVDLSGCCVGGVSGCFVCLIVWVCLYV